MELGLKGDIKILAVPTGESEISAATDFLSRFSSNAPKEKIVALLRRAPVTLAKGVGKMKAEKIIVALGKFGVKAVFEPMSQEQAESPFYPPPVPQASSAPSLRQIEKPDTSARAASKNKSIGAKIPVIAAVFAALLILGVVALQQNGLLNVNFYWSAGEARPIAPKAAPALAKIEGPGNFITENEMLADFDRRHYPNFDSRMAEGLAEAVREYARLFPSGGKHVDIRVAYTGQHTGITDFNINYDINAGDAQFQITVPLTTDPDKNGTNMDSLEKGLAEAAEKLKAVAHRPQEISIEGSPAAGIVKKAVFSLNNMETFSALLELGRFAGPAKVDPQALIGAGEILSWLAFIKSDNDRDELTDITAIHALANHLTGALFAAKEPGIAKSRALVWLGLGYPYTALQTLSVQPGADEELVALAAKRDEKGLEAALSKTKDTHRLVLYLYDRALRNNGKNEEADKKEFELFTSYPDFMAGIEFGISHGGVISSQAAPAYALELTRSNHRMINDIADSSWVGKDAEYQAESARKVPERDELEKWLRLTEKALAKSSKLKGGDKILTYDFLKQYISGEGMEAVYLCFETQRNVLASLEGAAAMMELTKRVWPNSQLAAIIEIKNQISYNNRAQAEAIVKKFDLNTAGGDLLLEAAAFYAWEAEKHRALAISVLDKLRSKSNPTPDAAVKQAWIYQYHGYHTIKSDLVRRAVKLDPYNSAVYDQVDRVPEADAIFKAGEALLGESPTFLLAEGRWARDNNHMTEAEAFYKKAIAIGKNWRSFKELSDIYIERKDYRKAVGIISEFAMNTEDSWLKMMAQVKLAKIYLAQKRASEAFNLMAGPKESWQSATMRTYARAAEMLGKKGLAEKYFQRAAERYPAGDAPVDLALFHLRANSREQAVEILKKYRKYNGPTYYFKEAVAHFKEKGKPEEVESLLKEVENGQPDLETVIELTGFLWWGGAKEAVANIVKPYMYAPGPMQPYTFAETYYNAIKKTRPMHAQRAFAESIAALSDDPSKLQFFAGRLHMVGAYKEAFDAFEKYCKALPQRQEAMMSIMAAEWKLGGSDPSQKEALEKMLNESKGGWQKRLVEFYLGKINGDQLLNSVENPNGRVEAYYAIAVDKQSKGEMENADKFYAMAVETNTTGYIAYDYAYSHLYAKMKIYSD